ncbi:MAG: RNA polymerase subunit sigma-70 [Phenylobacterium sp.]|uniref:RNA polymerase subunit sigma-70 n=1 Tax=Phenylobacterium sp. TaxID=1871053 RepID=UPI00391B0B46
MTDADTGSGALLAGPWRGVLAGDKDAYRRAVEPHLPELLAAAARELRYRRAVGDLRPQDLTADELVGETLARGWRDRARKPAGLEVRAWLLGLEFKVLESIVRSERRARKLAGVSLEAAVEEEAQALDASRWEDTIPAHDVTPADLDAADAYALSRQEREALVLVVEHQFSLKAVSMVMNLPPDQALRLLQGAERRVAAGRLAAEGAKRPVTMEPSPPVRVKGSTRHRPRSISPSDCLSRKD